MCSSRRNSHKPRPSCTTIDTAERYQIQRISKPGTLGVDVSNLNVRSLSSDSAEASFVQNYRSNGYKDTTNKTLRYQLENGQWKIVRESNR